MEVEANKSCEILQDLKQTHTPEDLKGGFRMPEFLFESLKMAGEMPEFVGENSLLTTEGHGLTHKDAVVTHEDPTLGENGAELSSKSPGLTHKEPDFEIVGPELTSDGNELTPTLQQGDVRKRRKPLLREELWNSPPSKTEEREENPLLSLANDSTDINYEALTLAIIKDIQNLPNASGMELRQESGQRSYGPPIDWKGLPPPKGCEVFVGKLPRQVFEPQLIPVFEQAGPIYELRMMIDFKGLNRGFCFIQYTNAFDAEKAINDLNNYEILPGRRIGVVKSVDNSRLFLRGIPLDKTEEDIFAEVETITDGVSKVQLGPASAIADTKKNRGFAYIEYQSHKAACMARRKLVSSSIKMWGREIHVDWALDGLEVKTLHVQNINPNSSPEDLKRIFNAVSQNGVEYVKIIRKYAFIQFVAREHAINARIALEGQEVDGAKVRINWAKPANVHNGKSNFNRKKSQSPPRSRMRNNTHNQNQMRRYEKPCPPRPKSPNAFVDQGAFGYQDNFGPRNYDPQRELHFMCISQGWAEPIYLPIALRQGQSLYYGCKVVVPHPLGPREYQTQNYYFNAMDAKTAAAEGLLRVMQGLMRPVLVALPNNYGLNMGRGQREGYNW